MGGAGEPFVEYLTRVSITLAINLPGKKPSEPATPAASPSTATDGDYLFAYEIGVTFEDATIFRFSRLYYSWVRF
jgi:hypothetical protein